MTIRKGEFVIEIADDCEVVIEGDKITVSGRDRATHHHFVTGMTHGEDLSFYRTIYPAIGGVRV